MDTAEKIPMSDAGRAGLSKLTTREWAVAAGLTLAGGVLAWSSATAALANYLWTAQPTRALAFDPAHGGALNRAAVEAADKAGMGHRSPEAVALARRAIRAQALSPGAYRVLGFQAEIERGTGSAYPLLAFSERLSRRDVAVQLWMLEYASAHGDINQTLIHYDSALRRSRATEALLFPILAGAIGDPAIAAATRRYVNADNPWLLAFATYAIRQGPNRVAFAQLARNSGGLPRTDQFRGLERELLGYLIADKKSAAARTFFVSLLGANEKVLQSVAFDETTTQPRFSPFTWFARTAGSIQSEFVPSGAPGNFGLDILATSPALEVAAQKVLMLPPGNYTLGYRLRANGSGVGNAAWKVECSDTGKVLGDTQDAISASAHTSVLEFSPGSDCMSQTLTLRVSSVSAAGAEVILDGLFLKRH